MNTYNPYNKYSSTDNITSSFLVEDWKCELVEPNHPALHTAASVDPFSSDVDWTAREAEMLLLMHDKFGIGLSANQIGSNYNMFVMSHSILGDIGVYKPKIIEQKGESSMQEGCLTFPLLFLNVSRPSEIKVRYTKTDGKTIVETWMDGLDARCFLHEYEHLQGRLYIEHVSDFKLRRAQERRDKNIKKLSRRIG